MIEDKSKLASHFIQDIVENIMENLENTVTVQTLEDYPAMIMHWQPRVNKQDLKPAFQQVVSTLNLSTVPMYVVVDLSENPWFRLIRWSRQWSM